MDPNNPQVTDKSIDDDAPDDFDLATQELTSGDDKGTDHADTSAADLDDAAGKSNGPLAEPAGGNGDVAAHPAPAPTQSDDIWKDAPAHLREAYEQSKRDAEYRLNSANGRVSGQDRRITELTRELDRLKQGGQAQPQGQQEEQTASDANDQVKQLREDYPEIANPLLNRIEQLDGIVQQLREPVNNIADERAQAVRLQQYSILQQQHPDWEQYANDDRFAGWLETQPRAVQEAAARNTDVTDGNEAAWVLGLFKSAINAPSTVETPAPQSGGDPRRQRQLQAGRDGGSGNSAPTQSGIPDDFDAATAAYAAKLDRQRERLNR